MSHSQNLQAILPNPVEFPKNAPSDARSEFLDVIKAMYVEYGYRVIDHNPRLWTNSTAWWDLPCNASLVLEYDRNRHYWEISASNCRKPIIDNQLAYWSENPESFQSFLRVCEVIEMEEEVELDVTELSIQELDNLLDSIECDNLLSYGERYMQTLDIQNELSNRNTDQYVLEWTDLEDVNQAIVYSQQRLGKKIAEVLRNKKARFMRVELRKDNCYNPLDFGSEF